MDTRYKIDFPSLTRVFRSPIVPEFVWVEKTSPLLLRKSVQVCATYFQREGYSDWLHYDLHDDDAVAGLFCCDFYHAIGACCFRLRKFTNIENKFWTMHWVWLHPYERNKGLLSKYLETFNDRFGYWYPEYPHSDAMQSFIKKHSLIDPFKKFGVVSLPH